MELRAVVSRPEPKPPYQALKTMPGKKKMYGTVGPTSGVSAKRARKLMANAKTPTQGNRNPEYVPSCIRRGKGVMATARNALNQIVAPGGKVGGVAERFGVLRG